MIVSGPAQSLILVTAANKFNQNFSGPYNNQWSKIGTIAGKAKILTLDGSSYSGLAHNSYWQLRDKTGAIIEQFAKGGGNGVVNAGPLGSTILVAPGVIVEDLEIWQRSYANSGYNVTNTITVGGILL